MPQNKYAEGLEHALPGTQQRAALFANRAACFMELKHWQNAARDCTEAVTIDKTYLKAWHRRCKAYQALGDSERALKDAEKVSQGLHDLIVQRPRLTSEMSSNWSGMQHPALTAHGLHTAVAHCQLLAVSCRSQCDRYTPSARLCC